MLSLFLAGILPIRVDGMSQFRFFYKFADMATTYKQPEKELSRRLLWEHAVRSLTIDRQSNRILHPSYMEHLWLYCQQQLDEHLDIDKFVEWKSFADICYGTKSPQELKVAFFCGNEPENDVSHLIRLGVRIENIYAFECDPTLFREAVGSLHTTYPLLKIYKGKIESYAELQNTRFDIVYLDFTSSLLKEYKTVARLLDLNTLADMSVLAVNTTYPDKTEENIRFLCRFFLNDTFFEQSVLQGEETEREEGDTWFYRAESCDALGITPDALHNLVEKNFHHACSAFQTAFLLDYANRHKPAYEVFKQTMLANRLMSSAVTGDIGTLRPCYDALLQEKIMSCGSLPSQQYAGDPFMEKKENGARHSRLDCMRLAEVYLESPYSHTALQIDNVNGGSDIQDIPVDFRPMLSKETIEIINNINNWFHGRYNFCDTPMEHLWLELLLNQYGHPCHTNTANHRRYSYTAKTRGMCLDIVTLDKCRALYDWLPMPEYFIHDMQDRDRQMITRMCMDAIDKQLLHIVDEAYFGAALVGINEHPWSRNKVLPARQRLQAETADEPEA